MDLLTEVDLQFQAEMSSEEIEINRQEMLAYRKDHGV
jgi:hypothetical protein